MNRVIARISPLILVLGLVYLAASGSLFSTNPLVIAGQLLAVALSIWARRSFTRGQFSIHPEPAGDRVIENGPYKIIRHPMYAAALLLVWSGILGHISTINLAIGLVITILIANRMIFEERILAERLTGYAAYALRTKRLIPFVL